MSDRFETELKQALKESTAKSLEGWEFSPAMRQAVLKRIAEEEQVPAPEPTPAPVPVRRPRLRIPQAVLWVAAAAAAFALMLNMDLDLGMGGAKKESATPLAATSREAPAAVADTASAADEKTGTTAPATESAALTMAPAEKAAAGSPESASQGIAAAAMPANPARLILTAPPAVAQDRAPGTAKGSEEVGIASLTAAPPVSMLDLLPLPGGELLQVTSASLNRVDVNGAVRWEAPLAEPPVLAATGGVSNAIVAGETVQLFNQNGQAEGSLKLSGPVYGMQVSNDGRVAVVTADTVRVYSGTKLQFQSGTVTDATVTFSADGSLAVMGREGESRRLSLFGRDGTRLAQAPLSGEGIGLVFADQGQVIVAGGEAFHRNGQSLWRAPFVPNGALSLGEGGPVLLWDLHQISLLNPQDGSERWGAEFGGGEIIHVVASSAGDQVAVLADTPEGPVVWVLTRDGGQRFVERLPASPTDLAVEGDQLILLLPAGMETRPLN